MTSALAEIGYSRRSVAGSGATALAWFDTWGARADPEATLLLRADTLTAPGLQLVRVWHSAARITLPRGGTAAALLPLQGRLRVQRGDGGAAADLSGAAFGISGGDVDQMIVAEAPVSWIGMRSDRPLGAGLVASDEALVLEDPDHLDALAVQMINTFLSRPAAPSPTSLAHLQLLVSAVLDGATLGALGREVHHATGMVVARTGRTPAQAVAVIRAHAVRHEMTVQEVADEILARRLVIGPSDDDR